MNKSFYKILFYIAIIYIIIVSAFLFYHRVGFSPDQSFAVALLVTLLLGRMKQFVRDWSAPVVLFLSYDYLRGLVPKLSLQAHILPMIDFDKAAFGTIPTNFLQSKLYFEGSLHWYDYLATLFYMSHFLVPMVAALLFWIYKKKYFEEYTLGLIILSYGAFLTYVFFPAAPPWMAGNLGFIPKVYKIMDQVFASFPNSVDLPSVYRYIGANLVAAVPSLHAAYPFLTMLYVFKRLKLWGLLTIPYVLGVWFSIVYLGEHYVFDIFVGVLYAGIIFMIQANAVKILKKLTIFLQILYRVLRFKYGKR